LPATDVRERTIWVVGDLRVDPGARSVTRDGAPLELSRLSFDLLEALIQAAPAVLSTDDLMDRVWTDRVVSPATVAKRIALLRDAIGDDSTEPKYVTSIRGFGYGLAIAPVREKSPGAPALQPASRRRSVRWLGALLVAIVALVGLGVWLSQPESWKKAPMEGSIAVLPFRSLGDDPDDQQFADGLTEEIIHSLAQVGSLRVAGRSSSFRFFDSDEGPIAIGETLNVAHLLEGSVRRSGNRVRIMAELIDTRDGMQRWSDSWERPMADVIAIQREISDRVSEQLHVALSGNDRTDRSITENAEAYALYLRAKSLMEYPYGSDLPRAQELLEQAVGLDRQFAAAWAHLAAVHGRRTLWNEPTYRLSPEASLAAARDAIDQALAADPEEGWTFGVLAGLAWMFEDDISKAARFAEQAVRRRPWDLDALIFAADISLSLGKLQQARQLATYVLERDPLCGWCRTSLLTTLIALEDYESVDREARLAMQIKAIPGDDGYLLYWLGRALLFAGKPVEAAVEFGRISERSTFRLAGLAMASHTLGDVQDAARYEEALLAQSPHTETILIAQVAAWQGDRARALKILNAWVERRDQRVSFQIHYLNPVFRSLRELPGWKRLLDLIGRSPEQIDGIEFNVMPYVDAMDNSVS
jgi:TolB-like protein/DNA-binding winged helix-turn-helix (wHTH) protein